MADPGKPYVSAQADVPEITLRVIVLGAVLSIVMAAANTYLGLKVGMTVSASIPAAVISMAILRGLLRRGSILENNLVQTMASTGESLAAGVIFTVPALVIIGAWQEFELWPTTLIVVLGGILGVIFMVPMRRALIVERPDLVYPEGVACSEVLIVGQEGGRGALSIFGGLAVGALFKLAETGFGLLRPIVETAFVRGRSVFYVGADISVALLAVGYIVDLQIAALIFLGGALGWLVAMPLLGGGASGADAVELANLLWSEQVRYLGVGAMLVGGIHSVWGVRRGIAAGLSGLGRFGGHEGGLPAARTERNLPLSALAALFALTVVATVAFYDFLIGSLSLAVLTASIMVLAAFLFVAVATYIAGLVGSSNSPVSGMTICALLIAAGVLLALGIRGDTAILATLGVAGVVCCATCTSGDIAQDLKTGLLVGATPARQQLVELVAVLVPALFFAPILTLLHEAYGIGTGTPGSLAAPQASLFASLTQGFFGGGDLPVRMIVLGTVLGAVLIGTDTLLARSSSRFRTHVMPVAVGIYLPFSLAIPILLGGLLRALGSVRGGSAARGTGILFASGLIAGEAIMGILLAIVLWQEISLPRLATPWPVSVVALLGVAAWLTFSSRGAE